VPPRFHCAPLYSFFYLELSIDTAINRFDTLVFRQFVLAKSSKADTEIYITRLR
jgi:hypothetical protein